MTTATTADRFKAAAAFVLPFGQHRGRTLDAVATTDDGLLYLDWLRGDREKRRMQAFKAGQPKLGEAVDLALEDYLSHPTIATDLDRLVRDR